MKLAAVGSVFWLRRRQQALRSRLQRGQGEGEGDRREEGRVTGGRRGG